jgi:SagB-type dehydrogenase family enzyme
MNKRDLLRNENWKAWQSDDNPTDAQKGLPQPPLQQPYPPEAKLIDLVAPSDFTVGDASFRQLTAQRRSRRRYTQDALSREELSFLLWATQGIEQVLEKPSVKLTLRTVPSGGALHSFETYLCINRITGIAPGLYRYLPLEHKLLVIREDADIMNQAVAAAADQRFVRQSAVFFIWTTVPYRTEHKYSFLAQKIIALDAGHVCQSLYLASESITAGACAIGAYFQEEMDALVGVDGENELTIYAATVGKVAQQAE